MDILWGIQRTQNLDIEEPNEMSDVGQTYRLCISINPNINLSSIQPVAIHGPADALSSFRGVEANHATALGLAVLHLDISILNHAACVEGILQHLPVEVKWQISDKDLASLPDIASPSSGPSSSSEGIPTESTIHVTRAIKLTTNASGPHPIHARAHAVEATGGEAVKSSSGADAVKGAGHSVEPGVAHAIHTHWGAEVDARTHAIQTRRAQAVKPSWAEAVHAGAHTVQTRSKPVHTGPQPVHPRTHPVEPRADSVQVRPAFHPVHAHPVHPCHTVHAGSKAVHSRAHAVHTQGVSHSSFKGVTKIIARHSHFISPKLPVKSTTVHLVHSAHP